MYPDGEVTVNRHRKPIADKVETQQKGAVARYDILVEFPQDLSRQRMRFEVKSGWEDTPEKFEAFKRQIDSQHFVAGKLGFYYRILTNHPIPKRYRDWLDQEGIPYVEIKGNKLELQ